MAPEKLGEMIKKQAIQIQKVERDQNSGKKWQDDEGWKDRANKKWPDDKGWEDKADKKWPDDEGWKSKKWQGDKGWHKDKDWHRGERSSSSHEKSTVVLKENPNYRKRKSPEPEPERSRDRWPRPPKTSAHVPRPQRTSAHVPVSMDKIRESVRREESGEKKEYEYSYYSDDEEEAWRSPSQTVPHISRLSDHPTDRLLAQLPNRSTS